jgi:spermidine synthase
MKYDLVVMNTTYYWRAYASLLLSKDFLEIVRSHMTADAVLTYNTTGLPDVLNTASAVFPHAHLYDSFAVCGFSDWRQRLRDPESATRISRIRPLNSALIEN